MAQPGATSRIVLASIWLLVGGAMLAVPGWLGLTRWQVLLAGHPSTLATVILCAAAGVVAVAWAIGSLVLGARFDREVGDPDHPSYRTRPQLRRRAKWRIGLAVPALAICLVTLVVLAWTRPIAATQPAVSAMTSNETVRVSDRFTWYEMSPIRVNKVGDEVKPTAGFIFTPGARVDPRAYARILRPIALAGYLVVVLKEPFGLARPDDNHAERVISVHPEITRWAVGGHSLGGVSAASFADSHGPQIRGLVLWASYPAAKLSRTDLKVVSISGSADGLTTPEDIAKSKANLPRGTRYVVVQGGVHAFFGDYGEQPGDGRPAASRTAAYATIVPQTRAFLASLAVPAKHK